MKLSLKSKFGFDLYLKKESYLLTPTNLYTQGSFCGVGSNPTHTLG